MGKSKQKKQFIEKIKKNREKGIRKNQSSKLEKKESIDDKLKNLIDIEGLDRSELLLSLWNNAKPCNGYVIKILLDDSLPDTNVIYVDQVIKQAESNNGFVDYAFGRLIKMYLFGKSNIIDVSRYDGQWGKGSTEKIVEKLRSKL